MGNRCLFWKPVICQDIRDLDYLSRLPEIISNAYRGNLFDEIQKMPRKEPISFVRAVQIINKKQTEAILTGMVSGYHRYTEEFVQFISECGYHVELSGDEFVFHLSKDQAL